MQPNNGKTISLSVKTLAGQVFSVECLESTSLIDLKSKIAVQAQSSWKPVTEFPAALSDLPPHDSSPGLGSRYSINQYILNAHVG